MWVSDREFAQELDNTWIPSSEQYMHTQSQAYSPGGSPHDLGKRWVDGHLIHFFLSSCTTLSAWVIGPPLLSGLQAPVFALG